MRRMNSLDLARLNAAVGLGWALQAPYAPWVLGIAFTATCALQLTIAVLLCLYAHPAEQRAPALRNQHRASLTR